VDYGGVVEDGGVAAQWGWGWRQHVCCWWFVMVVKMVEYSACEYVEVVVVMVMIVMMDQGISM
jgi:hypothetical protein